MSRALTALATLVVALLTLGYALAMRAAATGEATEWARRTDQAPIRALALLILVAAIAAAFRRPEGS